MQLGKLTFSPISNTPELVAQPVQDKIRMGNLDDGFFISAINPDLADTASFCKAYDIDPEFGANCIIVEAKRADKVWYAACLILSSDMIDVNGKVRRLLDARKVSFAPKDIALALTGMEYGGVTPIGLPEDLPILIDKNIAEKKYVIIGGGIRGSKVLAWSNALVKLDNSKVMDIIK